MGGAAGATVPEERLGSVKTLSVVAGASSSILPHYAPPRHSSNGHRGFKVGVPDQRSRKRRARSQLLGEHPKSRTSDSHPQLPPRQCLGCGGVRAGMRSSILAAARWCAAAALMLCLAAVLQGGSWDGGGGWAGGAHEESLLQAGGRGRARGRMGCTDPSICSK